MSEADVAELKAAQEKLTTSAQKVFAKMYEQSQAAGAGAAGAGSVNPEDFANAAGATSQAADDNVVDGDYKEI